MKFWTGVFVGFLLPGLVVAIYFALGAYNVAATSPPSKLEARVTKWALDRSVEKRAPSTKNPLPATPETWRGGMAHYRENCLVCHGAPGVDPGEIGSGLNPPAPDLTLPRVQARPDGQMFWIVANGIRTTGMPAFGPTHKDEELWKIVAFLRHLPELSAEEQKALHASGEKGDEGEDHHHEAGENPAGEAGTKTPGEEGKPAPASPPQPSHTHAPGSPPHHHGA